MQNPLLDSFVRGSERLQQSVATVAVAPSVFDYARAAKKVAFYDVVEASVFYLLVNFMAATFMLSLLLKLPPVLSPALSALIAISLSGLTGFVLAKVIAQPLVRQAWARFIKLLS